MNEWAICDTESSAKPIRDCPDLFRCKFVLWIGVSLGLKGFFCLELIQNGRPPLPSAPVLSGKVLTNTMDSVMLKIRKIYAKLIDVDAPLFEPRSPTDGNLASLGQSDLH